MKYLIGIMSGLELFDGIFTEYAVTRGLVNEANALVDSLITGGTFLVLKLVGIVVCSLALWAVYKRFPKIALTTSSLITAFYSIVLLWNVSVFPVV